MKIGKKTYTLEKDVEIPKPREHTRCKYPLKYMRAGESFQFDIKDSASIRSAASRLGKLGFQFIVRNNRCFCVKDRGGNERKS